MKNLFPFFTKLRSSFIYYIITQEFYTLYNIPILSWKDSTFNKSKNTRKPFLKMSKMRGNREVLRDLKTFSRFARLSWIEPKERQRFLEFLKQGGIVNFGRPYFILVFHITSTRRTLCTPLQSRTMRAFYTVMNCIYTSPNSIPFHPLPRAAVYFISRTVF